MSESYLWVIFIIVFLAIMITDLAVVDKGAKKVDTKKAAKMVVIYIAIALLFGLLIYFELGSDLAASYYAAYVIELSMSVDNLFLFIIIFIVVIFIFVIIFFIFINIFYIFFWNFCFEYIIFYFFILFCFF